MNHDDGVVKLDMHTCHNCDRRGHATICQQCNFAVYCNDECGNKHHGISCQGDESIWTPDNVDMLRANVTDRDLRMRITASALGDKNLRADIVENLHIDGKVFQVYMRNILKTKIGRKRVADKLGGKKGYLTGYTASQRDEILDIVRDDPGRYNREGYFDDFDI